MSQNMPPNPPGRSDEEGDSNAPNNRDYDRDADARENYAVFLKFRDALLAAGTLEGWYLATFQRGVIDVPPLFIDLVAHAVLRNVLDGEEDVYQLRAGELLFRRQRISTEEGHILSADADTIAINA